MGKVIVDTETSYAGDREITWGRVTRREAERLCNRAHPHTLLLRFRINVYYAHSNYSYGPVSNLLGFDSVYPAQGIEELHGGEWRDGKRNGFAIERTRIRKRVLHNTLLEYEWDVAQVIPRITTIPYQLVLSPYHLLL